jgi:hypothetical protein
LGFFIDDDKELMEMDRNGWRGKPYFNKIRGREHEKERVQPGLLRSQGPFPASFDLRPY